MDASALLVDLYQLTMLQGYDRAGMRDVASFEFFARRLPKGRNFLVAAGLEQVLALLESLRFTPNDLAWLSESGRFTPDFVRSLADWRFTGDVDAVPEGTIVFPDEPIVRVTAPIGEAQFVESRLINLLQFQTLIASKAARSVLAAPGAKLVDFGFRRAHGGEAGLYAARAAYLVGFEGTATVAAGRQFGIPLYGTMAHSFVQSFDDESSAFLAFARANPDNVVFLVDTYDTLAAVRRVVKLAPVLAREGIAIRGIRLDSGDMAALARESRAILDAGGLRASTIFASGGLDEYKVAALVADGAPIDAYGIGTTLDTSADAPYLDCAYKLVEFAGRARRKRSPGKESWPGRKQVYRQFDGQGRMREDCLTLEGDSRPGDPLLRPAMRAGLRVAPPESLDEIRRRAAASLASLPDALRRLDDAPPYRAAVSDALVRLTAECQAREDAAEAD